MPTQDLNIKFNSQTDLYSPSVMFSRLSQNDTKQPSSVNEGRRERVKIINDALFRKNIWNDDLFFWLKTDEMKKKRVKENGVQKCQISSNYKID